jgi:hypothetical protein
MTRAPEPAPSWLSRQQRRRINRQIYKLLHRDVCSICSRPLKHNSRTTSGLDTQGSVVVAGECCMSRVTVVFGRGFYSDRHYDFLLRRSSEPNIKATNEQIADAIAAYQKVIADTDKWLDGIERRGGGGRAYKVDTLDHPWKKDDADWFERHQSRAHRARAPFPGEVDKEVAETPAGHTMVMLVRQVEPGARLKTNFYLNTDALPVPDDEAIIHALFEVAAGREAMPPDVEAFHALIAKYRTQEWGQ